MQGKVGWQTGYTLFQGGSCPIIAEPLHSHGVTVNSAISAWTGMEGSRHDFQFVAGSVEVKTSSGQAVQLIRINGERQLDESFVGQLWLYHLALNVSSVNGETLPEIADRVRAAVTRDPATLPLFEDKLLSAGYSHVYVDLYQSRRYSMRQCRVMAVAGDFPRIKEGELRNGVADVTYSVSVAECAHYSVDFASFLRGLREG